MVSRRSGPSIPRRSALSPCTREWNSAVSARAKRWSLHIALTTRFTRNSSIGPTGERFARTRFQRILECVRIFSWEDSVLGKQAVPERVKPDGRFALRRLWSRGVESVRLVSSLLSFARHGNPAFRCFR